MKLYDIRSALKNLVHINKDLNKDRLTTLLQAAGWDEQDIKDAILLWETNSFNDADTSSVSAEIIPKEDMSPTNESLDTTTTIFADTRLSDKLEAAKAEKTPLAVKEESKLIFPDVPDLKDTPKEKVPETFPAPVIEVKEEVKAVPVTPPSVFDYVSKQTPHDELPHNLPLRPYESSDVTVPLNEYQKRFTPHTQSPIDTMPVYAAPNKEVLQVVQTTVPLETRQVLIPQYPKELPLHVDKVIEAPLETEDKYLAFIAIVLFILIMFILGYMHIIGRI